MSAVKMYLGGRTDGSMAVEVAYDLYHALVAAGHASWCSARQEVAGRCTCGRTAALDKYTDWRRAPLRPVGAQPACGERGTAHVAHG